VSSISVIFANRKRPTKLNISFLCCFRMRFFALLCLTVSVVSVSGDRPLRGAETNKENKTQPRELMGKGGGGGGMGGGMGGGGMGGGKGGGGMGGGKGGSKGGGGGGMGGGKGGGMGMGGGKGGGKGGDPYYFGDDYYYADDYYYQEKHGP
jgi:hypothetical protein